MVPKGVSNQLKVLLERLFESLGVDAPPFCYLII